MSGHRGFKNTRLGTGVWPHQRDDPEEPGLNLPQKTSFSEMRRAWSAPFDDLIPLPNGR